MPTAHELRVRVDTSLSRGSVPIAASGAAGQSNSGGRIDDIEYLRAIAILVTLVAHTPALFGATWLVTSRWFDGGSGVDLFFVISGYVITQSFLRAARPGASFWSTAGSFWLRRVFRLYPAAWTWLGISVLASIYLDRSTAFPPVHQVLPDAIAGLFQVENFRAYYCDVFAHHCAPGGMPDGVFWSLSLEEQFYLIFPFLILLLPRRPLTALLILAAAAQIAINRTGFDWFVRSDGLALGVLLALHREHLSRFEPRFLARPVARAACFIGMALLLVWVPARPHVSGLVTIIAAVWVFGASFDKNYVLPLAALRTPMLWLGTRSYSLYLCHLIAFSASHELWYRIDPRLMVLSPWSLPTLTGLLFSALGAELSYRFIETPCRAFGRRWSRLGGRSPGPAAPTASAESSVQL